MSTTNSHFVGMDNFGAFILRRNMFGPVRGSWLDNGLEGGGGAIIRPILLQHSSPLTMSGNRWSCRGVRPFIRHGRNQREVEACEKARQVTRT